MQLELKIELGESYHNNSQIARVVTEQWVSENMFCPRCGNSYICHFENNKPVADYYCLKCNNQYELKSKRSNSLDSIPDGAYSTMIERIISSDNPDFFFMSYNATEWRVNN